MLQMPLVGHWWSKTEIYEIHTMKHVFDLTVFK